MSVENDDTSNLPEFTPTSSNQCVQKTIQNSTITTVDGSVNVSQKTLIQQQAAMSSNTDKFRSTFCDQLKNLTYILQHNVNVEQISKGSFCDQLKNLNSILKVSEYLLQSLVASF